MQPTSLHYVMFDCEMYDIGSDVTYSTRNEENDVMAMGAAEIMIVGQAI